MTILIDTVDRIAVAVELYSTSEQDNDATIDRHNVEEITNIRERLNMLRNWRYHRCIFADGIRSDRVVYANGVDLTDAVDLDTLLDSAPDIDDPNFDPNGFPESMRDVVLGTNAPDPKSLLGYRTNDYTRFVDGGWEMTSSTFADINPVNPAESLTLNFVIGRADMWLAKKTEYYTRPFDAVRSEIIEVLHDGTETLVWQSDIVEKPENANPCAFKSMAEYLAHARERIKAQNGGKRF